MNQLEIQHHVLHIDEHRMPSDEPAPNRTPSPTFRPTQTPTDVPTIKPTDNPTNVACDIDYTVALGAVVSNGCATTDYTCSDLKIFVWIGGNSV